MMPYARTVITLLQGTLTLVEKSAHHLPKESAALSRFRVAIDELVGELEVAAKCEAHSELIQPANEDFYRKSG